MEALALPFEVKETDTEAHSFTGLAASYSLDLGGDVIEPGAFKRTLSHWRKSKKVLPLLDSHNTGSVRNIVGKLADAKETKDGLLAHFEVLEGPDGDEVFRRIKGGYVDGLSIGYSAVKVRYPETEEERASGVFRFLKEVKLHEISVVLFPMNTDARIDTDTAKAMLDAAKRRDLTDEERAALAALGSQIGALLEPKDGAPEPAPDAVRTVEETLRRIYLRRLLTRIDSVRAAAE